MSGDDERRQRAVMATDAEWERICRSAAASGMDRSRFVIHRALMPDALSSEVLRRAVRETLVLSLLEERRLREGGTRLPSATSPAPPTTARWATGRSR